MKEMTEFETALVREMHAWYKLADEAVGSWHRYVDTQQNIADSLEKIAEKYQDS